MIRGLRQAAAVLVCFALVSVTRGATDNSFEYQVKAVCVLNAARFVEWPAAAFADGASPIVIGILGDNPFGSLLQQAIEGELVNRRKLVVKHLSRGDSLAGCHILFVSRSESGRLGSVFQNLDRASVLTVSEIDNFPQRGGMVGLVMEGKSVHFEINPENARSARLKISSRLLSLAKIVK